MTNNLVRSAGLPPVLVAVVGDSAMPVTTLDIGDLLVVSQTSTYPGFYTANSQESCGKPCTVWHDLGKVHQELRDIASKEENKRQQKALKLQARGKKFKRFM